MDNEILNNSDFQNILKQIKEQEKKHDVIINFDSSNIRDKDHLNCIWYGGEVGSITYRGYEIVIGAYGDISIGGMLKGKEFDFKDKNNSGRAFDEFGSIINDKSLKELISSQDSKNYLNFENNNWFEVDLIDPHDKWIDLFNYDHILSDNILECFEHIEDYFEYVDLAIEGKLN